MSVTHGLSHADLEPSVIEKDLQQLSACASRVAELEAAMRETRNQLEEARAKLAVTTRVIEWKRLMAQVEESADARKLSADIEAAVETFCRSLEVPADYDDTEITYSDTDDFADLTAIESVFEDAVDEVRLRLQKNSAKAVLTPSLRPAPTSLNAAHQPQADEGVARTTQVRDMTPNKGDAKAVARHQAMLLLLVLSLHAGRLEKECRLESIRDPSNRPTADLEEVCENVASYWSWALNESNVLTPAERGLWQHIVTTYLGARFDSATAN